MSIWTAILAVALGVAASGCAERGSQGLSPTVQPATPTSDGGNQSEPPRVQPLRIEVRRLEAATPPTAASLVPTLEGTNQALAKALLLAATQETPAHERAVAAAYQDAGILDHAFRHLQKAVELDPADAAGWDGIARIWRIWGRSDVALGVAYRALYWNPNSAEIYNTLGTIMQALGQVKNAHDAYEHAAMLDDRAPYPLSNLCYLEASQGHGPEAEHFCRMALVKSPTFEPARNNLALALAVQDKPAAAEAALLVGNPTAARWYNVGMLRLATGRYGAAAAAFNSAADADPSMRIAVQRAVEARRAAITPEQAYDSR